MDKFFIEAACDEGFPHEWAMHHLQIYLKCHEHVTPESFVQYLHEIEAQRTQS